MARLSLICWAALMTLNACVVFTPDGTVPDSTTPEAEIHAPDIRVDVDMAPEFTLSTLDGARVALADSRGRWVIVNFWATWCGPCVDEMPYLQTIATAYAEELTVLGINMREDHGVVADFVDRQGIEFPILLDPGDNTLLEYSVRGLPLTYVVTPQGAIVLKQVGPLRAPEFDIWLATQVAN